jgi:homoserine dehydrogenase
VGLIGLGVVGGGVARALIERRDYFARQVGAPLVVRLVVESGAFLRVEG